MSLDSSSIATASSLNSPPSDSTMPQDSRNASSSMSVAIGVPSSASSPSSAPLPSSSSFLPSSSAAGSAGLALHHPHHSPNSSIIPSWSYTFLTIEETLSRLDVRPDSGLDSSSIAKRRLYYGANELESKEDDPLWKKFLEQFKEPLILLLLASAAVSLAMGQFSDAMSIFLAVVIVVTVGFVQEYRSEKSLEALNKLVPHRCHCKRDGKVQEIYAEELVPGDIVVLGLGDRVPADLRMIEAHDFEVDESSLTGETSPVRKQTLPINVGSYNEKPPVHERRNAAFMGTLVRNGRGVAVVVGTGMNTEFGVVFSLVDEVEDRQTPLQLKMQELGQKLSVFSLSIIAVIFVIGILQGRNLLETFNIGISLAVAAIPEGLPIVVTVTLALGVLRMAKHNAIVKKLPSVESLGCTNVVCVDKTGTLTQNEMTATCLFTLSRGLTTITGQGYSSNGAVLVGGVPLSLGSALAHPSTAPHDVLRALTVANLCNNSHIHGNELVGQPTEGALLCAAMKAGFSDQRRLYDRVLEIPFNSDTKWMAVKCRRPNTAANNVYPMSYNPAGSSAASSTISGSPLAFSPSSSFGSLSSTSNNNSAPPLTSLESNVMDSAGETFYIKGAVDSILDRCALTVAPNGAVLPLTQGDKLLVMRAASETASLGLRVIAVAYGFPLDSLIFAGFIGIIDPPRVGVREAVQQLTASGVQVVMITGDSQETAVAIAEQLGIFDRNYHIAISGSQIDAADAHELSLAIHRARVFFRTSPHHKMTIVKAFQEKGDIVAMTGDGVNDAPALRMADIGVAMGKSGTDVSKEAADMILIDDNFLTIMAAIEAGKSIFYNIKNFLRFQLSTSIAALSMIAITTLFGYHSPLNAMQILWINIIMDGPPAQSLGVEPVDHDVMKKAPRKSSDPIITRELVTKVLVSAFVMVAGTLYVYIHELTVDGQVTRRDNTMSFTTFILFDMFNALSCRSETKSVFTIGLGTNKAFLAAVGASLLGQLAVIYVPFLQAIFETEAISLGDILFLLCLGSTVFWLDELRKLHSRRTISYAKAGSLSV